MELQFTRLKLLLDKVPTWCFALLLLAIYVIVYLFSVNTGWGQLVAYFKSYLTLQFGSYILVGFGAQMIDGALGMAYGVSASSFLLATGVTPAAASASVHVAEVFTTGASAVSHFSLKNVNKKLFKVLVLPGVLGAITGAWLLSAVNGEWFKPFVSVYLLIMGVVIIIKAFRKIQRKGAVKNAGILALLGGFLDSVGGGGWGPVVNSTLLSKGRDPKYTIGTVNTVEFFVAFASAGVFTLFMGLQNVPVVAGLVLGGVAAAPLGAWLVGKIQPRVIMVMVGVLVILLSLRNLIKYIPFA